MELNVFKTTVLPLRSKLLAYARRLSAEKEDAEDAVQEVLLRLWNNRQELERYQSIEAFAMTLTHNVCMDLHRKRKDTLTIDNLPDTLFDTTPERLLELKDEVKLIRAIIDSLPNLQRIIMRMKDVEGYETEEIVQITGCNAEAIRSNLSRARKRVRDVYLKIIDEKKRRNRP